MVYEPLHHKYRPQIFSDLVGQDSIARTLSNAIVQQKIAPAYLFTGARGTGKTSTARIMAKSLNCLRSGLPTPKPCGECEMCRSIGKGTALDVTEIDAASNTGVDNIREIIDRAQFAPVQARYKVYVIDECLAGDTMILTRNGLVRIDQLQDKKEEVLSYNETDRTWEFKKILAWLDQGEKPTLTIQTQNTTICCTPNHLVRTDCHWLEAQNLQPGMHIMSPVTMEQIESISGGKTTNVYDISVEDNHNFVANGLLVHNCHMLSNAAFNALLKTLEEPPDRVVFILATTDPQRVLATIISRCQRFDFRRIPLEEMVRHLTKIAQIEGIPIEPAAISLIAQLSQGGLRDSESLLDQLSLLEGTITPSMIWDLVGAVPEENLLTILDSVLEQNPISLLEQVRHILDRGREPLVVLQSLGTLYRDLLIAKTAPDRLELVAWTDNNWRKLVALASKIDLSQILFGQQHIRQAEPQIKNTTQPRLWLEVTLMGLLDQNSPPQVAPIKIKEIEKPIEKPTKVILPPEPPPTPKIDRDAENLWQNLLNLLPPATKAALAQHGHCQQITNNQVTIGVKNQAILKIAEGKKSQITNAWEKILGRKVEVILTISADTPPDQPVQNIKNPSDTPVIEKPKPIYTDRVDEALQNVVYSFNGEIIDIS